jgi:hypothetical protein
VYDVHEWGLVRGTMADTVMLSGPHADAPPMAVAKPVLYFHREGEGALVLDVEARIPSGRIVEHWPTPGGQAGAVASWHGVTIQEGSCHGSRYPSIAEPPCSFLTDGCEAATLAGVETSDGDCLFWPPPPGDDGPTQAWNHLFYRGEVTGTPALPLALALQPSGALRVTAGAATAVGSLVRLRHAYDASTNTWRTTVEVAAAPAPGASVELAGPSHVASEGAEALAAALGEAGLTPDEIAAFRRAWDATLFGDGPVLAMGDMPTVLTTPVAAAPMPTTHTSLLYVLPAASADALATLSFTPPPRTIRRAIVVWMQEP